MLDFFKGFKRRNTSVELVRLLAISFIIIGHCCVFSGFYPNAKDLWGHGVFYFHDLLSQVGNGLFVAVFSYYLFSDSAAKKPTWPRMLSLYIPSLLYGFAMFAVFVGTGHEVTEKIHQQTFFPFLYNNYWFVRAYILFLVVYPFFYRMLLFMSPRQHGIFMVIFFLSIMAIGRHGDKLWGFIGACEFLCIFTVIGFFKRIHPKKPHMWYLWIPLAILAIGAVFGYVMLTHYVEWWTKYQTWMNNCVSLLILPVVVVIFHAFLSLPETHVAPVNYVARCSFGVYLFNGNTCNIQYGMKHLIQYLGNDMNLGPMKAIAVAWALYMAIGLACEAVRMPLFEAVKLGVAKIYHHFVKEKPLQENHEAEEARSE